MTLSGFPVMYVVAGTMRGARGVTEHSVETGKGHWPEISTHDNQILTCAVTLIPRSLRW